MSGTHHSSSGRRGARRVLAGGLAAVLGVGVMAVTTSAFGADEPQYEPGVAVRTFQVPYNLQKLCTIKPGQTPNAETVKQTIDLTTTADFGATAFADRFISHTLGRVQVTQAGTYQFELTSDDGSRLSLDGAVVVDHDGLHGAEPKTGSVTLSAGYHPLFIEHFEAGGGEQVTLRWKKPGDTAFSLVPTSALSTETGFARVTSPGNKECEGAQDSPGDGLQLDGVNPGYRVVDLRPTGFNPKVTGMAWEGSDLLLTTWGGTGDPVNQTSEGKLYRLEGVQTATSPAGVTVTELATKLREPQGVAVVDTDDDGKNEYYVAEKGQLSKFTDVDGDGTLAPKTALWTVPTSGNFHEFAFGLLHKGDKFYLNTSVSIDYGGATTNPQQAPLVDGKQVRGNSITIDDTTGAMSLVAGGLRTPNGIGFGPEGGTFVTDNQGGWLPASKLVHVKQGRFFNHRTNPAGPFQSEPVTKPVLWMPQNEIANSPSTPIMLTQGEFAGQMMIGDVTFGGLQRAFLEKVEGEYQGALFRGTQGLEAGVNEVLAGPDGTIITGGIGGGGNWEQAGKLTYGLQKLVPTGAKPFEMKSVELVDGGFKITYTEPLAAATLTDLASKYAVTQWGYRPTAAYGGPKIDEKTLTVTSATPSADGTSVTLALGGLQPDRVVHLRSPRPFASADGDPLYSTEAWYTLNTLPGYVAPPSAPATPGLYELEDQQLDGTANPQTEHAGYSGSGFVAGFDKVGAGVTSTLVVDEAGRYDVALRYANGPNPFQGPKSLSLVVNDEERELVLPSTGTWKTWATHRLTLDLDEGQNTVVLRYDADDDGNVNLDFLKVAPAAGTVHEAEDGLLENGAKVDTEHAGFTGSGFMGGTWNEGASTTLTVHAAEAGDHPATIRFANGPNPQPNQTKHMTVQVGDQVQRVAFPPGGSWKTWLTKDVVLPLELGDNQVTIKYAPGDEGNVNIDHLAVRMPGALDCGTDPVGPDDTFDGDRLDLCRWNVVNEVRSGYRVADGRLEIDARPGDLSGGTTSADNLVLQRTPQADSTWTAATTVAVDGTDDYIQSGLVAYTDSQNYGKLVVMHHPQNGWVVELGKVSGGALAYSPVQKLPVGANVTGVRLELASDGEVLRGRYSVDDGATWTAVGAQPDGTTYGLSGITKPLLGLAAYNGTGSEVATFDDFAVGEPVVAPDTCSPAVPDPGYEMLYDGTRASMADWRMADGGSFLRQPDCSIVSDGAFGLWWHTTPIDHAYSLKLDWKKPSDDNSGVFVGFPDPQGSSGPPITQGHEVQIDSTDADNKTTGAIYNFQGADRAARDAVLRPDGEWNSYEIVVEGDRIRVYLNGTLINDFTDTDPARMNLPSHVGLQTHGVGDEVYFRNVQIKDLDAVDPEPVASTTTVSADPATVEVGQASTVTVAVAAEGATATGEVTLTDNGEPAGTATLVDGEATLEVGPYESAGTRTLVATYAGDEAVAGSSGTTTLTVREADVPEPAASTVTAKIRQATVQQGARAVVAVTVDADGVTPTGKVAVRDGARLIGSGTLAKGKVSITTTRLTTAGTRTLTVAYLGDDATAPSQTSVRVTVRPRPVLALRSRVVDADRAQRTAVVKVVCRATGARCVGSASLRWGGKVLGTARFSVASGRNANVTVALTSRARSLLSRHSSVPASLVTAVEDGSRTVESVRLTR